ncbi:MAG: glutamine-hydrolyzing carbamoyl-phosphate synthase small subunit [Bacteriovoracia bacterium]
MRTNGALVLEDGSIFPGYLVNPVENGFGEVVFNTGMCGYQEILTDPSYWEQIVVMTYPHQGNYGVNEEDIESLGKVKVAGFVVRELTKSPSNFSATDSLENYLSKNKIPALEGVDTRALTLHIRSKGAMRGVIVPIEKANQPDLFNGKPEFKDRDLIKEVTTKQPYWFKKQNKQLRVLAFDFGIKLNLLRELSNRNLDIYVVPANTSAQEVIDFNPDGIFLSNGPGDPSAATYAIETVKALLGKYPIFGVCMGHQILALALGGKTHKMKFGHRGANQPVINKKNGTVEISSHNHGFAVTGEAFEGQSSIQVTHTNLNDGCCEGLECKALRVFSVQYHPESAPGPHDSTYLFDKFVDLIKDSF